MYHYRETQFAVNDIQFLLAPERLTKVEFSSKSYFTFIATIVTSS